MPYRQLHAAATAIREARDELCQADGFYFPKFQSSNKEKMLNATFKLQSQGSTNDMIKVWNTGIIAGGVTRVTCRTMAPKKVTKEEKKE